MKSEIRGVIRRTYIRSGMALEKFIPPNMTNIVV